MQKLNAELKRLYLTDDAQPGQTRAITLSFRRLAKDDETGHWERLCAVANAVQADLGLPAPAVSISGEGAFGLWLSLAQPVPMVQAQGFAELLGAAYCPESDAASEPLVLPPSQHQASGKWAAFIHPGMGTSFAGDEGLEMQPPEAGQVALLEGLASITPEQFAQAFDQLRGATGSAPPPPPSPTPGGLLLKDATLEDIVNFLHAKNIEPTFRFLK
ncbi:MAG: hypothetical protein K0R43_907 [Pseudoduganella sp.]|jgi:hypothetical protein|nr:hypothetical protein [Pseudoduganella sp.]